MDEKTIAAIATPIGEGGISVIRVSGREALLICDRVFCGKKKLSSVKTHTIHYGHIIKDGQILDEVLASVMLAPHSYTGENVVEISCHGGLFITRKILSTLIESGAILATRGEFTKRAFLNGKLDLSQAEAVIDLINAETESAACLSVNQLKGKLSEAIDEERKALLHIASHLDAMADFPDEGIDSLSEDEIEKSLRKSLFSLQDMLNHADQGRLIREGIKTVIVGKPNVGKSSLLNRLSGTDRALVTMEAGTTRDVIEEQVTLGAVRLNLFDTAGIRNDAGQIEALGIEKAKEYIKNADLVFFVLDASDVYSDEDKEIAALIQDKKTIVLLNKADLCQAIKLPSFLKDYKSVTLSAKTGEGFDELSGLIEELFDLGVITKNNDTTIINLRHKEAIFDALASLESALETLLSGMPADLLSVDLHDAVRALGEVTGQTVSDEIIDEIFSRFCLGK